MTILPAGHFIITIKFFIKVVICWLFSLQHCHINYGFFWIFILRMFMMTKTPKLSIKLPNQNVFPPTYYHWSSLFWLRNVFIIKQYLVNFASFDGETLHYRILLKLHLMFHFLKAKAESLIKYVKGFRN
jgi:hypothetical protein